MLTKRIGVPIDVMMCHILKHCSLDECGVMRKMKSIHVEANMCVTWLCIVFCVLVNRIGDLC
jgi:hypothetical protein